PGGYDCCYQDAVPQGSPQYSFTTAAELHTWDGMNATWTYYHTATSEIDLGASADGSNWKVSGTAAFNTEKGTTTAQGASNQWAWQVQPKIEYQETQDYTYCFFTFGGGPDK